MAAPTFTTETAVKTTSEMLIFAPHDVIVVEELRGRTKPVSLDLLIERAKSMMTYGQLQPITVRRDHEKRPVAVFGFTRLEAAKMIVDGFTDELGNFHQDKNFKIRAVRTDANDTDAFIKNIIENCQRNATSPIDDARNQARLRDKHGKTDDEIAAIYGIAKNKVVRLRQLLNLSDEIQEMVHDERLTVNAAIDLLDIAPEKRKEAIQESLKEDGTVHSGKVRAFVRDTLIEAANPEPQPIALPSPILIPAGEETISTPPIQAEWTVNQVVETPEPSAEELAKRVLEQEVAPPAKTKSRSMKEMREYFDALDGPASSENLQNFAKVMLEWMSGRKTDKQLDNAIAKLEGKKK